MPKNIVLLSDGTGNSSANVWRTNVWRIFESLDLTDSSQIAQIAIYDDGVGNSSFKPLALLGGAFGWGLKRNVLHLYSFLCRNYQPSTAKQKPARGAQNQDQPGDQIYAFGFSRGAFTIRVLMDLVLNQGLVPYKTREISESQLQTLAKAAYRAYRTERYHTIFRVEDLFRQIRDGFIWLWNRLPWRARYRYDNKENTQVCSFHFLGLWDTVAAYGLPIEEMTRGISQWIWPLALPDTVLSEKVERACHALSLDDERTTFHPSLWTETYTKVGTDKKPEKFHERVYPGTADHPITRVSDERISQVWFAGVHANVGGGYPDDSLAHVPLCWIMNEAMRCGLRFAPDALRLASLMRDKDGRLYDSRQGLAGYYRYGPRNVDELSNMIFTGPNNRVTIEWPKIHCTAIDRIRVGAHGYAPIGFPRQHAIVNEDGTIDDGQPITNAGSKRIEAQQRVWNTAWVRRVNYFITLFVTLTLVLFPGIILMQYGEPTPDAGDSSWAAFVIPGISAVGALLPSFASPWVKVYFAYPGWFTGLAALVGLLTWCGSRLGQKINSEMRLVWTPVLQGRNPPFSRRPLGEAILWLRTRAWYQAFIRGMKRHVVPFILTAIMLYAGLVGISRVLFATGNSLGLLCKQSQFTRDASGPAASVFVTNSHCWNSGLTVDPKKVYDVIIKPEVPWSDDSIQTTPEGFGHQAMTWPMYAALPLRRNVSAAWFRPIARIGHTGTDEQVLDPEPQHIGGVCYVARLKPRTSGELNLFVNDAVIGFPWLVDLFYQNNHGTAQITVTEAKDEKSLPACP